LSLVAAVARLHGGKLEFSDNQPGLRATLVLAAMAGPARVRPAATREVQRPVAAPSPVG